MWTMKSRILSLSREKFNSQFEKLEYVWRPRNIFSRLWNCNCKTIIEYSYKDCSHFLLNQNGSYTIFSCTSLASVSLIWTFKELKGNRVTRFWVMTNEVFFSYLYYGKRDVNSSLSCFYRVKMTVWTKL